MAQTRYYLSKFWTIFIGLLLSNIFYISCAEFSSSPYVLLGDISPMDDSKKPENVVFVFNTPSVSTKLPKINFNFTSPSTNPTNNERFENYVVNFFKFLGAPKELNTDIKDAISLFLSPTHINDRNMDYSRELILKSVLVCLIFDDVSNKFLDLISNISNFKGNDDTDIINLIKLNIKAMIRQTVSSNTFLRIFIPFIDEVSKTFFDGKNELAYFCALEVFVEEKLYSLIALDLNKFWDESRLVHFLSHMESQISSYENYFDLLCLSPLWPITYNSLRILHYYFLEEYDSVLSILSSSYLQLSYSDLVLIVALAVDNRHPDVFPLIFGNSGNNLDYSKLLSSSETLSHASHYLKDYLPNIYRLKLDPDIFELTDNTWPKLRDILLAKSSIEQILAHFFNCECYFQFLLAFYFDEEINFEKLANEIKLFFKNPELVVENIIINILPLLTPELNSSIKTLLSYFDENNSVNLMIIDRISKLVPSIDSEREIAQLIDFSCGIADLFGMASEIKNIAAITNLLLLYCVEDDFKSIKYSIMSERSVVYIRDGIFCLVNCSGDNYYFPLY